MSEWARWRTGEQVIQKDGRASELDEWVSKRVEEQACRRTGYQENE